MHEKLTLRLEEGLQKMQAAAESGRLKDEAAARACGWDGCSSEPRTPST